MLLILTLAILANAAYWMGAPHQLLAHAGQCGMSGLSRLASLMARQQGWAQRLACHQNPWLSPMQVNLCPQVPPIMLPRYALPVLQLWGQPFHYQQLMEDHQYHCGCRPCSSPDNTLAPPINFDNIRVGPWQVVHDAY